MRKELHRFSSPFLLAVLVGAMSWGSSLRAQDTPSSQAQQPQSQPSQAPDQSGQSAPSQTSPSQTAPPDQAAPSQSPAQQSPDAQPTSGGQTFTGTVVKAGSKYVLQDAASGTTYDIDHQDEVAKFEGKKVRIHGTLDASGKMIHVQ